MRIIKRSLLLSLNKIILYYESKIYIKLWNLFLKMSLWLQRYRRILSRSLFSRGVDCRIVNFSMSRVRFDLNSIRRYMLFKQVELRSSTYRYIHIYIFAPPKFKDLVLPLSTLTGCVFWILGRMISASIQKAVK